MGTNVEKNVVEVGDLDSEKFERKTVGTKSVITTKPIESESLSVDGNRVEVKVSGRPGNLLEITEGGAFVAPETIQPVINEDSTSIVKSYVSLVESVVIPSETWKKEERAIVEHRNGLNILHLDIKFKTAFNRRSDTTIGTIPTTVPRFNTLTEVQVLGEGIDGFVYVDAGITTIRAKGTFPANKRIVVKLIGYTK